MADGVMKENTLAEAAAGLKRISGGTDVDSDLKPVNKEPPAPQSLAEDMTGKEAKPSPDVLRTEFGGVLPPTEGLKREMGRAERTEQALENLDPKKIEAAVEAMKHHDAKATAVDGNSAPTHVKGDQSVQVNQR